MTRPYVLGIMEPTGKLRKTENEAGECGHEEMGGIAGRAADERGASIL